MTGALQVGSLVRHVGLGELGVVTGRLSEFLFRVYWLSPRDECWWSEEPACDIEKVGSAFVTLPPGL